jgi:hypothetical protein
MEKFTAELLDPEPSPFGVETVTAVTGLSV